jgi:hypothetical protein
MSERKFFGGVQIKDIERGELVARVATLNVVDHDADIIPAGAIADDARLVSLSGYAHNSMFGDAPTGKGRAREEGDAIIWRGRAFLNTAAGREAFAVLLEMGGEQEWSFGFRILQSELPDERQRRLGARRILSKIDIFEVSPVLIGAGIRTATLSAKTEDEWWAENERRTAHIRGIVLAERDRLRNELRVLRRRAARRRS